MRLGYGTASLMGRLGARESQRLIAEAYDNGITHFDTARMYGYGEAEGVLGRFLRGKRDRVTIATKAGILPPRRSPLLSAVRTAARAAVAVAPALRSRIRRGASATVQFGAFDAAAVRASLETSLRELQTEYVDLFLLHECTVADLNDALYAELCRMIEAGLIKRFGIATKPGAAAEIIVREPRFAQTVQLADSLLAPSGIIHRLSAPVTHSIFSGDVGALASRMPQVKYQQSGISAVTLARRAMLEYALRTNRDGIVIFSSSNPSHITENVRASRERMFSDHELDTFAPNDANATGTAPAGR